jgi:hypothetical protein
MEKSCWSHRHRRSGGAVIDGPQPGMARQSKPARSDGNNARVWGGMHYPSTVAISDREGQAIANYVNLNSMQLLRGQN